MTDLVDRYIAALDALPTAAHPHILSDAAERLLKDSGDPDALNREAMRRMIANFDVRRAQVHTKFPETIVAMFQQDHIRILGEIATKPKGYFVHPHELFCKDLGVCRLTIAPAGAQVAHVRSGIPRSIIWKDGPAQAVSAAYFLARTGFQPYFEIHTHTPWLSEFTPIGWDRCYIRVASLLEENPEIKGMIGGSWFYDPEVERVSPRLAYLRRRPLDNGAKIFYLGGNSSENIRNATATSATRRTLVEQGKYKPVAYMMVWARAALVSWANKNLSLLTEHQQDVEKGF